MFFCGCLPTACYGRLEKDGEAQGSFILRLVVRWRRGIGFCVVF